MRTFLYFVDRSLSGGSEESYPLRAPCDEVSHWATIFDTGRHVVVRIYFLVSHAKVDQLILLNTLTSTQCCVTGS